MIKMCYLKNLHTVNENMISFITKSCGPVAKGSNLLLKSHHIIAFTYTKKREEKTKDYTCT